VAPDRAVRGALGRQRVGGPSWLWLARARRTAWPSRSCATSLSFTDRDWLSFRSLSNAPAASTPLRLITTPKGLVDLAAADQRRLELGDQALGLGQ